MRDYKKYGKMLISVTVAIIIVSLYGKISTGPFVTPAEAGNIKNLLSNLKFNPNSLTRLFTINIGTANNQPSLNGGGKNSFAMPTVDQLPPTGLSPTGDNQITPTDVPNCTGETCPTPTANNPQPTVTDQPTNIPKPTVTKYIKPTKVPPLPPITTDTRPGTSLTEIFQEVNKRECIPVALLMAFKIEETGDRFMNDNSNTIGIYNTYGWWITGHGDPCYGYGYYTQLGTVPQDSVNPGTVCQNPIPSGADQGIMGIEQISQFEQDAARKYTTQILPKNLDRRVIFDNALIFAIITKNRLGTPPSNCDDWPNDAITTAAEKHYGSCGDNYCANILKYYKQYSK